MSGLPNKFFIWPRDVLESSLGITRADLRKAERCGVLRRTDAPAFSTRHVRPYERKHLCEVFGIKE